MARINFRIALKAAAIGCTFLLIASLGVAEEIGITATIKLNYNFYDENFESVAYKQGDGVPVPTVPVWITLHVAQDVWTDDHAFEKKFEWLLDVRDPFGRRYPPLEGDLSSAPPIPPTKEKVLLEAGDYDVVIPSFWDYYWPDPTEPVPVGDYTVQFVLSLTVYSGDVAHERVIASNIETFKIWTETILSVEVNPDPLVQARTPNWVTCYIRDFPDGYGPGDVDIDSAKLWNEAGDYVSSDWGAIQGDQLMIKFPGPETSAMMAPPRTTLTATGRLGEYTYFSGTDTIKVKVK
jgi:hypothetical protein